MATTKGKDSSSLGKEKRVTSPPSSRTTNITKTRLKTPTTTALHHKPSSTTTEKQVPSYLRPTQSSRHDQSLRYVKKSGPEDSPKKSASPNRRRSFDTAAPPPASRLQSSFSSSSPRERTVTVRSTSVTPKTTSSLKPVAERTSRSTLKAGKPNPSHARVTKKSTTPANKKETNIASASAKDQEDVDITESFNLHIAGQDDEEFLVHEVEEIVEVKDPSENDEHSDIVEDEKVKLCDIPEVSEEKTNPPLTADIEESGDIILQEEKVENQPEGDQENGSNEIHPEESFASETTVEVKEDKEEEGGEEKEIVDENKQNEEKEMVDGEIEELVLKEEENVEGGGFEETKSEVAENTEISSIKEEQKVDGGVEESTTMSISSKRQVGLVGKKESQAYNDVIEETASKLLEKRKNKVKALVGAFETVIDKESSSK